MDYSWYLEVLTRGCEILVWETEICDGAERLLAIMILASSVSPSRELHCR